MDTTTNYSFMAPSLGANDSWMCDPLSPLAPVRGYRHVFQFELWMNPYGRRWWLDHWTLCFWIAGFYLAMVLAGQRLMRGRSAPRLRLPLLAWNAFVAFYSLLTGGRVASELATQGRLEGFLPTLCALGPVEHQQMLGFYLAVFAITKVLELGDTAFLVLRGKPVSFMHCFHHSLVLVVTWAYTGYPSKVGAYFMAMNQIVHFLAYSYLALRVMRVPMPSAMVPFLAVLELLQVVVGFGLTAYAARAKRAGATCCLFDETMDMIFVVYAAFVVVFSKFLLDIMLSRWWKRKEKCE